jgi:hypothetical protein
MNWLGYLLTFPISVPVEFSLWTARKLAERTEEVFYDEGPVRSALMELEMKLDMGEIDEETFEAEEALILARLKEIREYKAANAQ